MRELLYIAIGDSGFGIWDDEVLSVNENINLHHIPLTGDIFAGIIQIDGRVATVADLAECTGFQRMKHRQCQVLLLSEKEDIAGFAIEQKVRRYEISTENILKLPDCLHSQIVDTCVIYSSKPIPVINIKALYGLVKNKEYSPQTLLVPDVYSKPADLSGIRDYKYIKVGNELFAFPDRGLIDELPAPGVITASVLFPKYVKGVTLYNNSLLPLVSLARKMKIAETGKEEHTIIMEIEKNIFGFLSDSAAGYSNELIKTAGLPPIARSPWMKSTIIDGGKIIPVIDPAAVIMPKTEDGTIPVASLYLPENSFENNFGERDAEVTEFLILNAVYSLPRSEVKDTIPCGGIRRIPGATPIVIGVSEYEGELIPVLDPALYFGVYSQVSPDWKMILVENGNFRAFLVTKKVRDPRIVEASGLNRLPIRLTHNVVYGCYPDSESGAMRLILNTESMAVHFDKKSVKEFFHAFSLDTGQSPVAEIPEQLPENNRPSGIEEPASSEIIRPEESQPAMTSGKEEHADAAEVNEMPMPVEIKENINPDIPVHETQAPEEERAFPDVAAENKTGPINESPVSAGSAGTAESDKLPADFPPQESATEPPRSSEEPVYNSYADEKISSAYEEIVLDEDKYFAEVPGETTREEITPSKSDTAESAAGETAEPEPAAAETDVPTANFPEETPATSDSRVIYSEAQNIKKESEYIAGLTTEAKQEAEIEEKSDAEAYQESVTADSAKENMPESVPEEKIAGPVLIPAKTHPSAKNNYLHASLGLLVIILIFLISAFLLSRRSADDKPEQSVMPVKEKITAQKEDTLQKEEIPVPIDNKREETGKAEPEKSEQNEIKIGEAPVTPEKKAGKLKDLPSKYDSRTDWDSSSDFIIYNVIQGDELYYITEQFTGNGFDYWNIARDNKIDNPDLIFPEQKIKLRKNYIRK